jgi:hypothetical protein
MKQNYVPPDKRSKRQQKEYYGKSRKDWNGVNPATKKLESKKLYNRKKAGQWNQHEPLPGLTYIFIQGVRCFIHQ